MSIYHDGQYLEATQTWHTEDSRWKAEKVANLLGKAQLRPETVWDIGCGAGEVVKHLAMVDSLRGTCFRGYDPSEQAIGLARSSPYPNVSFTTFDPLASEGQIELALLIDVFEHVDDYLGLLRRLAVKAEKAVFHVPLDLHASSVLRDSFVENRYNIGHIHYFSERSAIATVEDSGFRILDVSFTCATVDLIREHHKPKRMLAYGPRLAASRVAPRLGARLLGGFSLLILAESTQA